MFTNRSVDEVREALLEYRSDEFANPGEVSTETVVLNAGGAYFSRHSNTIEPYLRQLGLPTSLHEGVITLDKDYTVCVQGQ
jgi:mRNA turnover protein 4